MSRGKRSSGGRRSLPLAEARSGASAWCDRLSFEVGFAGARPAPNTYRGSIAVGCVKAVPMATTKEIKSLGDLESHLFISYEIAGTISTRSVILDPAYGAGDLLIACADIISKTNGSSRAVKVNEEAKETRRGS